MHSLATCWLLLLCFYLAAAKRLEDDEDQRIELEVLEHQPCAHNKYSEWDELVVLPDDRRSPVTENKRKPGCYRLGGTLKVREQIKPGLQMYLEVKNKPDPLDLDAPQPCHNASADGCGGIGSCLYCDPCEILQDNEETVKIRTRELKRGRKINRVQLDCDKGLKADEKRRVFVQFCLPTKKSFLEIQGLSEEVWEKVNQDGEIVNKIGIFIKVRLFNTKMNSQMRAQRSLEGLYRRKDGLEAHEPLPEHLRKRLPFNRLKDKAMIGCHIIVGNLFLHGRK